MQHPSNFVKILGVVLDPRITLSEHTKAISKSCFYHIHALKHIRDSLDSSMIQCCHVTSWLDYANSFLYSIPAKYITHLQRTQNTLARVVAGNCTILPVLIWMRYFKTGCRFTIVLDSKLPQWPIKLYTPVTPAPRPYMANLVQWYTPSRTLWSASANLLSVTCCNISFGARGFRLAAPAIWNSLPSNVRSCETLTTFRWRLKSHLFHSTFATA